MSKYLAESARQRQGSELSPEIWILSIDLILSVLSVLVVAQSSSEVPEGLVNNPVFPSFPIRTPYRVIHKSVKHLKNSQQIDYSTDHGISYADRERNSPLFFFIYFTDAQFVHLW